MSGSARIVRIAEVSDGFCGWPVPVVGVGLVHKCLRNKLKNLACQLVSAGWGVGGCQAHCWALRQQPCGVLPW